MYHDPIRVRPAAPPPGVSQHPMARPAAPGLLRDMVLSARQAEVQRRLTVAMLVAAGLLVALIASGYLRAALGHRL